MTKNLFFFLFKKTKKNQNIDESEQAKQLAEIGAQLRQFREQHQITLERVSVVTMIRSRLLEAIEAGEINELPEPIYTHGLIKRYAEAMGFDSEEFANFCATEPLVQQPEKTPWGDFPLLQLRPTHLYILYVLIIVASINGLSQVMNRSEIGEKAVVTSPKRNQPSLPATKNIAKSSGNQSSLATAKPLNDFTAKKPPEFPDAAVRDDYASSPDRFLGNPSKTPVTLTTEKPANLSEKVATPAPIKATNASIPVQPKNQAVTISVTVKEETWAMIEVDGKTEFEGNLPVGTQRTWQAKEQLIFRAGNAGGVLFAVNNGKAKPLGEPGEIEEVVLKAKESPAIAKGKDQG
ncbi:hypothetical protein BCD67_16610 [Oscillatoriales cyanobacterium USR001]|nr:hypothetical protein BCD67_16610 [Oscillatoriales cyanobacterium USR001]